MFGEHAYLYDLIYHDKDYASEATQIRDRLAAAGVGDGSELLEAACGTGRYLRHLEQWYETAGFDLSSQMVELAADQLDGVDLFVADMVDVRIDDCVDALLCLFSSVGYVHGEADLRETFRRFADALKPGGVAVVEPWIGPDDLVVGHAAMNTYEDDDIKVCRQAVTEREGRLAVLDFHWLVAETDGEVEHLEDRHELYLHTHDEYVNALEAAGFAVDYDDEGLTGRGLYVATKS